MQAYVALLTQTGKTRSLLAFAQARPSARFLYITFTAATAREARQLFPSNVVCSTMHALALRHVSLSSGQPLGALRPRDVVRLLRGQLPEGRRRKEAARPETLAVTSVATYVLRTLDRFLQSSDSHIRADRHVPKPMLHNTDLRASEVAKSATALWELICVGTTPRGKPVPCPHDAYVKLWQLQGTAHPFGEYTALLLDEAQDLSACQAAVLLRARGACAVLVVGDVHQTIYGFRGGSAAAFHAGKYAPTAHFTLTQSFRFGPQVAAVAGTILQRKAVPAWMPRTQPPHLRGTGADCVRVSQTMPVWTEPHTRIYRTNALLAHDALRLAAHGNTTLFLKTSQAMQPAALATLLRDAHTLYHAHAPLAPSSPLREFAAWKELVEHVEADDGGGESKLALVVSLSSLLGTPLFLDQVAQLERCCSAQSDAATIILTTVHQAKGLEWDTVVLADDFSPAQEARVPSLDAQVYARGACDEINHMYVALTRAQRRLVLPPGIHQWLIAVQGLYRFRFAEKSARAHCALCGTTRVALVEMCEARAWADRAAVLRTRPDPYDAQVTPLGCLPCMRARLGLDPDLEDFVRWVDASGVSTTTGRLTPAAMTRTVRKYAAKGGKPRPTAFALCTERASVYAAHLDERKACARRWLDMRTAWLAEVHAPETMQIDS